MKQKKRLKWADISKGIGILLVKIGHHEKFVNSGIVNFIYSFHMPLFFIISGFFISQKQLSDNFINILKHKIKAILFPYFIYSFIYWLVCQFLLFFRYNFNFFYHVEWEKLVGIFIRIPNSVFMSDHWFFWTLFFAEIIYIIILKIVNYDLKKYFIIIFLLAYLSFVVEKNFSYPLVNNLDLGLIVLPFIMVGNLFRIYYNKVTKIVDKYYFIIVSLILCLIFGYLNFKIGLKHIDYNRREIWEFLTAFFAGVFGSMFVILSTMKIKKGFKFIEFIGRNSAIYYLVSWIGEGIFPKVFNCFIINLDGWILFIIQMLGACLFPIPIIIVINTIKGKIYNLGR